MTESVTTADELRRAVSETYARVSAPTSGARLAGYTEEQFASLPSGVAQEFYGCGNPLAFAEVKPGDTVLDLGSGAGLDLILAGQAVGPTGRVIGVDMTDEMIARARRNIAAANLPQVEIRKGVIERLPVEDASVDWVISNCVISLSPEKERVFQEIARVLKPGGRMVISDIMVDDGLEWILKRLTNVVPSIALARTEAHYLRALKNAGLANAEFKGRFVYETDHLLGMVGDNDISEAAGGCPVSSISSRYGGKAVKTALLSIAARRVSGHVWSSKLYAQKAAG